MNGAELILHERMRQIAVEGWTAEHDDGHIECELADAAMAYIGVAVRQAIERDFSAAELREDVPSGWPWEEKWWKPSDSAVRNLVIGGALIAAEIDRMQRLWPVDANTKLATEREAPDEIKLLKQYMAHVKEAMSRAEFPDVWYREISIILDALERRLEHK